MPPETPPFACPHNLPPGSCHYAYCIRPAHSAFSTECNKRHDVAIDEYKARIRQEADERLVNGMREKERAYRLRPNGAACFAPGDPQMEGGEYTDSPFRPGRTEQLIQGAQPVDPVHPAHYKQHPSGVECIDIIEHMTFNTGTAIKYLWRAGSKAGESAQTDLRKAIWYIEREMQRVGVR